MRHRGSVLLAHHLGFPVATPSLVQLAVVPFGVIARVKAVGAIIPRRSVQPTPAERPRSQLHRLGMPAWPAALGTGAGKTPPAAAVAPPAPIRLESLIRRWVPFDATAILAGRLLGDVGEEYLMHAGRSFSALATSPGLFAQPPVVFVPSSVAEGVPVTGEPSVTPAWPRARRSNCYPHGWPCESCTMRASRCGRHPNAPQFSLIRIPRCTSWTVSSAPAASR